MNMLSLGMLMLPYTPGTYTQREQTDCGQQHDQPPGQSP